jgi:hypothetical protein
LAPLSFTPFARPLFHFTLSHKHKHTHTHTHIFSYIHTHTRTHTHTHTHTFFLSLSLSLSFSLQYLYQQKRYDDKVAATRKIPQVKLKIFEVKKQLFAKMQEQKLTSPKAEDKKGKKDSKKEKVIKKADDIEDSAVSLESIGIQLVLTPPTFPSAWHFFLGVRVRVGLIFPISDFLLSYC